MKGCINYFIFSNAWYNLSSLDFWNLPICSFKYKRIFIHHTNRFFSFCVWAVYAMTTTAPVGLFVMGGLIWWGYFAFETAMNGGKTDIESLFGWAGNDFKNNFGPNTWEHRLSLTRNNDEEWAEMFPGKGHCIFTHVLLPLIPLLIWIIV